LPGKIGLRDQKKATRTAAILATAERLFAEKGIEATTMAAIAEETGISTPTVFNYFGTKDKLLAALIMQGTDTPRSGHRNYRPDPGTSLAEALTGFLGLITEYSVRKAGRRIWRYAESALIRHPNTDFAREYAALDTALIGELQEFLTLYARPLRSGDALDAEFLARLFYRQWGAHFIRFMKDDSVTLDEHRAALAMDIAGLVRLIFDDGPIRAAEGETRHDRLPAT
jgi:AcrR family transcriptional regulator